MKVKAAIVDYELANDHGKGKDLLGMIFFIQQAGYKCHTVAMENGVAVHAKHLIQQTIINYLVDRYYFPEKVLKDALEGLGT